MVVPAPAPFIPPGLIVQLPAGKLFNTTLPVVTAHVGCVIVPIAGGDGALGTLLMTIFAEAGDVQNAALVTV